jgi:hypothetical protein
MAGLHVITLLAVVAFAGYTQYQAKENVRAMQRNGNELLDAPAGNKKLDLISPQVRPSRFARENGNGHPFGSVVVNVVIGEGIDGTTFLKDPPARAKEKPETCDPLSIHRP